MKLRDRTLLATGVLVLAPLLALALLLRREMRDRLDHEYTERVDGLAQVVDRELAKETRELKEHLDAWKDDLRNDNRLRLALEEDSREKNYLLDAAGRAMILQGLDFLQIQDETGKIVSSGHFRNEFDRLDRETIDWLAKIPEETALLTARRAESPFFALARLDSLRLGGSLYFLLAGKEMGRSALAGLSPDPTLTVSLVHPQGALSADESLERLLGTEDPLRALTQLVPQGTHFVRTRELSARIDGRESRAHFAVTHSLAPRDEILQSLDTNLALAWALAAAGSIALAVGLSARIARPIEQLAHKTETLDLDRLEADFSMNRRDELGTLSLFLDEMTKRLRTSVTRLRDAERRATLGELARQVSHDLKSGFTPIRNVVRHLSQIASESPQRFLDIYREREGTLQGGLAYLEELAASWARLSGTSARIPCDLAGIVAEVALGRDAKEGGTFRVAIPPGLPPVLADPVGLRRVIENLVTNACESLRPAGRVEILAEETKEGGRRSVRLEVRDSGRGIPAEDLDRIFDPFYTTKETGSGLGLAIVKRLVSDYEGAIDVKSEEGRGTEIVVTLPAAELPEEGRS